MINRTGEPKSVSLREAAERLHAARERLGHIHSPASCMAEIIWPNNRFLSNQGAGAAASRVLKRLEAAGVVFRRGKYGFWMVASKGKWRLP